MSGSSTFEDLDVSAWLLKQCAAMGLKSPTPVQYNCIPKILCGSNCVAVAKTGSGKTLAFALPILQKLAEDPYGIFALILTPTRELAIQIGEQFNIIGKPMQIEVTVIIGGMSIVEQGKELSDQPHIVIATPGRLADLLQMDLKVTFKRIQFLVLDEGDRLFEGSFSNELEVIANALSPKKQTLMFSATMPDTIPGADIMPIENPFVWSYTSDVSTVSSLDQRYILVPPRLMKNASLVVLIDEFQEQNPSGSIIVFTKNTRTCFIVSSALKSLGFHNVHLNSTLKQRDRLECVKKFKSSECKLLIATDIASRGLDIPMVDLVINYTVPPIPKIYIHRVGRTARAGNEGRAITFVTPGTIIPLKRIETEINTRLTEYQLKEKKVRKIMVQIETVWCEAELTFDGKNFEEKKMINKRKDLILQGKFDELKQLDSEYFFPGDKKKSKKQRKNN